MKYKLGKIENIDASAPLSPHDVTTKCLTSALLHAAIAGIELLFENPLNGTKPTHFHAPPANP